MSQKHPTTGKYPRGHKPAPPHVHARLHAEAFARHGHRNKDLPIATQPAFDCRTVFKNVLPEDDQMQCGDCYGVSSFDGCSMALIYAGVLPLDASKGRLSSQYGLDNPNAFQGGCGGGDEAEVIDFVKQNGAPLTSDYGPYQGSPGNLKPVSGMKLYKIGDWGYCTPSQQSGVAATQDMKNSMATYGPLSVAFDASGCDNYNWPGTMTGGGNSVDHAVLCIGWDDAHDNGDGSKGAFLGMNQWGPSWGGPGDTFWIKYGSYSWGTEAIWISGGALPPTPPATGYTLWEGTMTAPVSVGVATGYPDTATATAAGQTIANADQKPVMIHDPSGAMVATIQPNGPPVPPIPPVPPTPPCPCCTGGTLSGTIGGLVPFQATYTPNAPAPATLTLPTLCQLLDFAAMIDPTFAPEINLIKPFLGCTSGAHPVGAIPRATPGLCAILTSVATWVPSLAASIGYLKTLLGCAAGR